MGRKPDPEKPARDAKIVALFREGMSYADIAHQMGVVAHTVAQIIRAARKNGTLEDCVKKERSRSRYAKDDCGKLGRKLDLLLHNAGTTPLEISEMIGVTENSLSRLIRGNYNPDLRYLSRLAMGLGITVSELTWLIEYSQDLGQVSSSQEARYTALRRKVTEQVLTYKRSKVS